MSNTRSKDNNEIDLHELYKILWDGKWTISVFVFLSLLFGIGILLTEEISYKSKLIYKKHDLTQPPFFNDEQVDKHFNDIFFSELIFKDWKNDNKKTALLFRHLDLKEVVNGVVFLKNDGAELVEIVNNHREGFILVKTNKIDLINDLFNYSKYVNDVLSHKYVLRAQKEVNLINKQCNGIYVRAFTEILFISRFILSIEEGKRLFAFERPTKPIKISLNPLMIFFYSVLIGGMMGVFYVILQEFFNKYKNSK
jgi:hypothetical protein